jgi:hypothetical protein
MMLQESIRDERWGNVEGVSLEGPGEVGSTSWRHRFELKSAIALERGRQGKEELEKQ